MAGDQDIIAGAFAAALDDSLWLNWSVETGGALGGVGGTFFVIDLADARLDRFVVFGRPEELLAEYIAGWGLFDPQVPMVMNLPGSAVYASADHVDPANPDVAAYMAWQRWGGGIDHHLTAAVVLDDRRFMGGLSVHRSIEDGAPSADQRQRLTRILPELQRAMQLGFRHSRMLADSWWEGLSGPSPGQSACLLDERGRMIRATPGALAILSAQNDVTVRQDRLCCADPVADERLGALVHGAVRDQGAESGALGVRLRSGRTIVLVAYPLPRRSRMLAPYEAAALLRIVDPAARDRGDAALYRQAFRLTAREAELAALLVAGHSPESAANVLRIGVATARQHLRSLFAKTGTARQIDLVHLLSRIAP